MKNIWEGEEQRLPSGQRKMEENTYGTIRENSSGDSQDRIRLIGVPVMGRGKPDLVRALEICLGMDGYTE